MKKKLLSGMLLLTSLFIFGSLEASAASPNINEGNSSITTPRTALVALKSNKYPAKSRTISGVRLKLISVTAYSSYYIGYYIPA